jgi:hypothetical protein
LKLPSLKELVTEASMDILIRRLEALHRMLRAAPTDASCAAPCDPRIVEAVADCLRELHAIAARSAEVSEDAHLRLVVAGRAPHRGLH